jgi:gas vesicle protein
MGYNYDRRQADSSGGSFVMGLLTGAFLGAGLGMLLAPKAGSELRNQLSDQADSLGHKAADQYGRVTGKAREWVDRGREAGAEVYDKARDLVSQGAKSTTGVSEKFGPGTLMAGSPVTESGATERFSPTSENEPGPGEGEAARPFGTGSGPRRS